MGKREVNSPHGSKLGSARLLILAMEALRSTDSLPVSRAAIRDAGSIGAARDQQRLGMALTNIVLYVVVVELVVKHIWEQEHSQPAEHSHDVRRLFQALSSQIRCEVEALYDKCCVAYESAAEIGKQQHGAETVAVDMASLEDALRWNEIAVKNFKYEMRPRDKSMPTGMFWNSETLWVLPGTFPNFAIDLTRWAAQRNFRKSTI